MWDFMTEAWHVVVTAPWLPEGRASARIAFVVLIVFILAALVFGALRGGR